MKHNDLGPVAVATAMIIGKASGMLHDPVVWAFITLAASMGMLRLRWFWLVPIAAIGEALIVWMGAEWRQKAGLQVYPSAYDYALSVTALLLLLSISWLILRLIPRPTISRT